MVGLTTLSGFVESGWQGGNMKRTLLIVLALVLFGITPLARGQRRGPAGGGGRPSGLATKSSDRRPSNPGRPETSGVAADHRSAEASLHAVDLKDTHGFKN